MNNTYAQLQDQLRTNPRTWLITGVAGFIGSNLLQALLQLDQHVVGLDNFATGHRHNLEDVRHNVSEAQWKRFHFIEGDIRNIDDCRRAMQPSLGDGDKVVVDHVLHQAALGSVPRSIDDPITTNACNIDGFLNMLVAARDAGVKRFVYAASSSTYGDHLALPKVEDRIGKPLSPYAVTKYVNELYADVFARIYGLQTIGLRYFNIFGERQDPNGAYAAVIPKWIRALLRGEDVFINGDGETSRDFCYVQNAVQANILAALTEDEAALNQVYNVAVGERTSLNRLFEMLRTILAEHGHETHNVRPRYREFRPGDVRHSLADISKARRFLGYEPRFRIDEGLRKAMRWYMEHLTFSDTQSQAL